MQEIFKQALFVRLLYSDRKKIWFPKIIRLRLFIINTYICTTFNRFIMQIRVLSTNTRRLIYACSPLEFPLRSAQQVQSQWRYAFLEFPRKLQEMRFLEMLTALFSVNQNNTKKSLIITNTLSSCRSIHQSPALIRLSID